MSQEPEALPAVEPPVRVTPDPKEEFAPNEAVSGSSHVVFLLCAVMVVAFGVWASVRTVDIVSSAIGEVIPSTQVKSVQHLEGGIVSEILVHEGEKVKQGQPLVSLEPTASGADVGELRVRLNSLKTDIARLTALVQGAPEPTFDDELIRDHPDLVANTLRRFQTILARHESDIARQTEAVTQKRQEISEISTRIKNGKESLKLVKEQVVISEKLLKDQLTNRFRHLDLLKEASQIRAGIEADTLALDRANSALKEAKAELTNLRTSFDDENQKALGEARLTYGELTERIQKFEDSLERTVVRSPVDGTIKTMYVVTIGGVLRPGDLVADIVPTGDRLIIEAKLPPQDIGFVAVGQRVRVTLASNDAIRFGSLDGEVINVSPDTLKTREGTPFYKVLIRTERDRFQSGEHKYNLFPGMRVVANIQTGTRTVLEYITDPIRRTMSESLHER